MAFVNVPKLISDLRLLFHEPDAMEARLRSIRNAEVACLMISAVRVLRLEPG